ncbi:NRDE family protein [Paludibacterium yongneupense]
MPSLGQLVLIANRDEYYARPSAPLDWWEDHPGTLGGRDLQAGGSWLAVDVRGRFAAVTNFREGYARTGERSRGELVERFVTSDMEPLAFAGWLKEECAHYAPFNLLFGQVSDLFHFHSRGARLERVTPGIHTLSNATLDTAWPKCVRLADHLRDLRRPPTDDQAFGWLEDTTAVPAHALPNTGVGSALERALAPVFVQHRDYGTCASMLVTVSARGDVAFAERRFGLAARETGRRRFTLRPGQAVPAAR